jgi:hypothetical protein
VLVVGAMLMAIPFETGMWDRAPKGAAMIQAFAPYMQAQRLDSLQKDVAWIDAGEREAAIKGPALLFPHARGAGAAQKQFAAGNPELALFSTQWRPIHKRLVSLLDPIQANRHNYAAIAALPSFTLFPWFLVVPGAILVLLSAAALLVPRAWSPLRWGILALGVGLMLAPLALQMFDRAPKGERLISAFRTVETGTTLTALQNDFGSLAIGQGALRTELVPALRQRGFSQPKIDKSLPAVTALDGHWVAILGDLTPMLGVMSNNMRNYQAVAALPAFTLFPWLFVIPGLLATGLVLVAGASSRLIPRHRMRAPEPQATRIPDPGTRITMTHRKSRVRVPAIAVGLALAGALLSSGSAISSSGTPLTGTLVFARGKLTRAHGKARYTGTYFRMLLPGATDKYFANPDSRAKDKTYTLLRPGTERGLSLGKYQPPPTPAFASNGFALAKRITQPETFASIKFSISTAPTDAQSGRAVGAPRLTETGSKITGNLAAWTAEWNRIYFNQGAPKPGGSYPGLTQPVTGTYNHKTKAFAIVWYSAIVGGPFSGFTGYWHLQGTVRP